MPTGIFNNKSNKQTNSLFFSFLFRILCVWLRFTMGVNIRTKKVKIILIILFFYYFFCCFFHSSSHYPRSHWLESNATRACVHFASLVTRNGYTVSHNAATQGDKYTKHIMRILALCDIHFMRFGHIGKCGRYW